jgi:hypothetical protein
MGLGRQSRAVPRKEPPEVRRQERDLWLLESIGKMRFLTTSQLARLGFEGSRSAANKRLRKLLDERLVRVWMRSLAEENIYSLNTAGAKLLPKEEGKPSPWVVPRSLESNLEHLLTINEVRIAFALALGDLGEIRWWRSDWELRGATRGTVVPDALFGISWGSDAEKQCFALEVENRTRSPLAFLRKILRYRALLARGFGIADPHDVVVLVVGRDERWLERYRLAVSNACPGFRIAFGTLAAVREPGPLEPIWKVTGSGECYSLRDLGSLPYGKEGEEVETAVTFVG